MSTRAVLPCFLPLGRERREKQSVCQGEACALDGEVSFTRLTLKQWSLVKAYGGVCAAIRSRVQTQAKSTPHYLKVVRTPVRGFDLHQLQPSGAQKITE